MILLIIALAGIGLGLVIIVPLAVFLFADWLDYRHDCRARRRLHAPLQ